MVHFLRTPHNRTIIECEVMKSDLRSGVDIETYTFMFLEILNGKEVLRPEVFIEDIDRLNNLRRIWFENDPEENESIDNFVSEEYKSVAEMWDLIYIVD